MNSPARRNLRTAALAVTTAGLMALGLGSASAHVGVTPTSTTEGGYTQLNFTVPSESDDARTEQIEIQLPTEAPFSSVRAKPVEGWTSEVVRGELPEPVTVDGTTVTEGVLSVVWTADDEDHQLSSDEYQVFSLSVGRLPDAGTTVSLPAIQSYSDGSVSSWDQVAGEGADEPDSPAPSFVTTAEEASEGDDDAVGAATVEDTEPAAASTDAASGSGSTVTWLALTTGLIGLAAGVLALLRTRGAK